MTPLELLARGLIHGPLVWLPGYAPQQLLANRGSTRTRFSRSRPQRFAPLERLAYSLLNRGLESPSAFDSLRRAVPRASMLSRLVAEQLRNRGENETAATFLAEHASAEEVEARVKAARQSELSLAALADRLSEGKTEMQICSIIRLCDPRWQLRGLLEMRKYAAEKSADKKFHGRGPLLTGEWPFPNPILERAKTAVARANAA